jgi:hypothetical protein
MLKLSGAWLYGLSSVPQGSGLARVLVLYAKLRSSVQCRLHRPMEGVQGFTRSHWTPSSVKYLHHIPPLDDRVAFLKKYDEKAPYLPAILLAVMVRRYDTKRIARWRGSMATPEATGPRHQVSIAADSINGSCKSQFFPSFFIVDPLKRGLGRCQDP